MICVVARGLHLYSVSVVVQGTSDNFANGNMNRIEGIENDLAVRTGCCQKYMSGVASDVDILNDPGWWPVVQAAVQLCQHAKSPHSVDHLFRHCENKVHESPVEKLTDDLVGPAEPSGSHRVRAW